MQSVTYFLSLNCVQYPRKCDISAFFNVYLT